MTTLILVVFIYIFIYNCFLCSMQRDRCLPTFCFTINKMLKISITTFEHFHTGCSMFGSFGLLILESRIVHTLKGVIDTLSSASRFP